MLAKIPFLFTETTRALTPSAPAFDPSKKEKYWSDQSLVAEPDGTLVSYAVINDAGDGFTTIKMSVTDAIALNIEGHPDYPPAPPQLFATYNNGADKVAVCDRSVAEELAKEIPGADPASIADLYAGVLGVELAFVYPAADPGARAWVLTINGVPYTVTYLLGLKNAAGVGAPGKWDSATWVSTLPSPDASSPRMKVPIDMSKVPAGSTIGLSGGLAGIPELIVPDAPAPVATTGGNFNAATDPTILDIQAGVKAIRGLLHV